MTYGQGALFDAPNAPGRRSERTEWGCRYLRDTATHKRGQVDLRSDENAARFCLTTEAAAYGYRVGDCEPVRRTIVTFTDRWEAVV